MSTTLDIDVHQLAGIRLVDAGEEDVAAVRRQLGLPLTSLGREPEIILRFVDRIPLRSRLRYLGQDDAAFADGSFLVLRSRHKSPARVEIPLDRVGERCEIVCERGLLAVPLLIPILNLTILAKGAVPLHAAAFRHGGAGWLATGWSKGGKTETLLSFMENGGLFVGDEWVYLTADGQRMYGIPEPIRLWSWHLSDLPRYTRLLGRAERARLRAIELAVGGLERMSSGGSRRAAGTHLRRVHHLLRTRLCVDVSPERLFGSESCPLEGTPDKVLFVISSENAEIDVRPIDPQDVAARMAASLQHEQRVFQSYYWKFRFAFPERRNELVESSHDLQRQILSRALEGKETYEVAHPYPVEIPALFSAIRARCTGGITQ